MSLKQTILESAQRGELDPEDVLAVEESTGDEAEDIAAIQRMIDAGAWSLQGSFGRTMMGAIESGACMLGPNGARDYWGNYIPSRTEVKPGTKGSPEYHQAYLDRWAL